MAFTLEANGNIAPSRFVKRDSSEGLGLQCGSTEKMCGISAEWTRRAPYESLDDGYAAIDGESLKVYEAGDVCKLQVGSGGCAVDDVLSSDGDGKGVTNTTDNRWGGAKALQAGAENDLVLVKVLEGARY